MVMTTPLKKQGRLTFDRSTTFVLTNEDDHTITFTMPGRKVVVEPGQRSFVTLDLITIYFGDPRSLAGTRQMFEDSKGKGTIPAREFEVNRLKVLYGIYSDATGDLSARVPQVKLQKSTGRQFLPPAFDPDGTQSGDVAARDIKDLQNVNTLSAIIAEHERQLEEMRSLLDSHKVNGPNDETELEVDLSDFEYE